MKETFCDLITGYLASTKGVCNYRLLWFEQGYSANVRWMDVPRNDIVSHSPCSSFHVNKANRHILQWWK